jgi:hypothetical protein
MTTAVWMQRVKQHLVQLKLTLSKLVPEECTTPKWTLTNRPVCIVVAVTSGLTLGNLPRIQNRVVPFTY